MFSQDLAGLDEQALLAIVRLLARARSDLPRAGDPDLESAETRQDSGGYPG